MYPYVYMHVPIYVYIRIYLSYKVLFSNTFSCDYERILVLLSYSSLKIRRYVYLKKIVLVHNKNRKIYLFFYWSEVQKTQGKVGILRH